MRARSSSPVTKKAAASPRARSSKSPSTSSAAARPSAVPPLQKQITITDDADTKPEDILWPTFNTRSIQSVPPHLAFNIFVRRGYRPFPLSYKDAALSLFQLHNETLNVWTHLSVCFLTLYFFFTLDDYDTRGIQIHWAHRIAVAASILAASSVGFLSASYHLFMAATPGPEPYRRLLSADMWGIVFVNAMICIVSADTMLPCQSLLVRFLVGVCPTILTCSILLLLSPTSKSVLFRATAFLSQLLARFSVYAVSYAYNATGRSDAEVLIPVLLVEMTTILGTAINAARLPERFFPGGFDLFHSHTVFHIMTAWVLYTIRDIWMGRAIDAAEFRGECTAGEGGTPLWAAALHLFIPSSLAS